MTDPVADAGRWLDERLAGRPVPPLVVVVGLGTGHVLLAIEKRSPETRVLAFEPDPNFARPFLTEGKWRRWTASGRLTLFVGPDYQGAEDAWRLFPHEPNGFTLLVDPALERNLQPSVVEALRIIKRLLFGARANAAAQKEFAPRYLLNTLRNLPALLAGQDVRALTDRYRGVPAVVAAAGPSLDGIIAELGAVKGRALLVAVDTALRPLLVHGVAPHLVVGLDPSDLNARHYHLLADCPDTWLVAESGLDRSATREFDGRTYWYRVARHHPWPFYNEVGIEVGYLEVWGSVLTAAFQTAVLAGCDPIVFVGADLAFTGGHPYCRGTTFEFDWAKWAAYGYRIEDLWQQSIRRGEPVEEQDLHGFATPTRRSLVAFRDWLVTRSRKSGRRVVNCTGAGILFGEGVTQSTLEQVLRERRIVPDPPMDPTRHASKALESLPARLRALRQTLDTGVTLAGFAAQWAQFTGDGWNPGAVAETLDEIVEALESGAVSSVAADVAGARHAWHTRAASLVRLQPQLPEAVARWRAALSGLDPLPSLDGVTADANQLLGDAFDWLQWITRETSHMADLPAPVHPLWADGIPVCAVDALPERIRWAVLSCEALLGAASRSLLPPLNVSFYSRGSVLRELQPAQVAGGSSIESSPRPTPGTCGPLCAVLAIEWMMCARQSGTGGSADADELQWLRSLATVLATKPVAAPSLADGADGIVVLRDDGDASTVEIPFVGPEGGLSRLMTGLTWWWEQDPADSGGTNTERLPDAVSFLRHRVELDQRSIDIIPGARQAPSWLAGSSGGRLRVKPRMLTDEAVPAAHIVYPIDEGAVCVDPNTRESFVVRPDGSSRVLNVWPRPIDGELPFGTDGAVAWGKGSTDESGSGRGYAMVRRTVAGPVTVHELPFRPVWGAWYHDRVYWACTPTGVGSWAPDAESIVEFEDLTLGSIFVDEAGLTLIPYSSNAAGYPQRVRVDHQWAWEPGDALQVVPQPDGAASAKATSTHGWIATVHPDADAVDLTSADGRRVRILCYYPFRVAWLGPSLLVSTVGREILLFHDFSEVLGQLAWRPLQPGTSAGTWGDGVRP
jgi:hypothetical protein